MSEEVKDLKEGEGKEEKEGEVDLANMKAEFSRKIDNQSTQFEKLQQSQTQVIAALNALAKPAEKPAKTDNEEIEDFYDDPTAYRQKLKDELKQEMLKEVDFRDDKKQSYQNTIVELVNEFPELNKESTPMYKKAMEILETYPKGQRSEASVMRAASYQAAAMVGLQPKSQREETDDDSFSLSAVGGSKRPSKVPQVDDNMMALAKLLGVDTEDEKVMESLKGRTKRDSWTNWR